MVNSADIVRQCEEFGLNTKQAQVYLELLQRGDLSPVELSRRTGINRTTLYRLLESLEGMGLVERILGDKRTRFQAGGIEKIQLLVSQKEAELASLKGHAIPLMKRLSLLSGQSSSSTKVLYFHEQAGLQQLLWNTLKTKGEQVGYGYLSWNESVGQKFAEKLREEYVMKKIPIREIRNPEFTKDFYTGVKGYKESLYVCRYIPKKVIELRHSAFTYNDVFAFFYWYGKELFGVEMHNKEIARTQKQIFNVLWGMAKSISTYEVKEKSRIG